MPDTHVLALVRNPADETSKSLKTIVPAKGSSVTILKLDVANEQDYTELVATLGKQNIASIDIAIANAGISKIFPLAVDAKAADLHEHMTVNVVGPLLLFQALHPYLVKSKHGGKFVAISSSAGSIGGQAPVPNAVYGTSKAALNFIVKKMHTENEDLVIFPLDPGWVQTEMGINGAVMLGFGDKVDEMLITTDVSVEGMVKVIEGSTREETGGRFKRYNGEEMPW